MVAGAAGGAHRSVGWWIRRVDGASKLYDVIRIDHFRGFEAYWAVPYGETTAKNGHWVKGPGMSLVGVLTGWFPQLRFIAEDLGYPTPGVQQLLQDSGLPGMKVLNPQMGVLFIILWQCKKSASRSRSDT